MQFRVSPENSSQEKGEPGLPFVSSMAESPYDKTLFTKPAVGNPRINLRRRRPQQHLPTPARCGTR